jgi:secreted PhoX family phosphatase
MKKSMQAAQSVSSAGDSFEAVVARRLARRSFLKTGLAAVPALAVTSSLLGRSAKAETASLAFQPVPLAVQDQIVVPSGYQSQTLIRWGDPLFENAPSFDPLNQTAERQRLQCGYNCDFLAFFPLPPGGRPNSRRGLLTINHEFTNPELMFPNYSPANTTRQIVDVELAAHGLTIVEIVRRNDIWTYTRRSPLNRRLTAETPMQISGPAAGHPLMKTSYDPAGTFAFGSLNNCSGGVTPWGTLLTAEENFNQYFANAGSVPSSDPRAANHMRYGLPNGASDRRWELFHSRFDVSKEPNEAFRFGWVIEIDPYDPSFVPRKRTALGRMKHEAAATTLSKNGLAVVYTGDDERFEYLYKFISRKKFKRNNREANLNLLDDGLLLVAKFNDDGTGEWRPLVGGSGALAALSHEEVLINTRAASDLVGGTRMDRPEDVEMNPVNGKVYAVFTNNTQRGTTGRPAIDGSNPRVNNRHGHIIEITETDDDAAARTFTWEIFMLCGDPANSADATFFSGFNPAQISPISSPDNITFDPRGNLWIATDGQPGTLQKNDGIYAVPVEGSDRGFLRQFLSGVIGSETASLLFSPNGDSLFVSIQHPGEGTGSTFLSPSSLFPDGTAPPRPTVVAVTRTGSDIFAGPIGS